MRRGLYRLSGRASSLENGLDYAVSGNVNGMEAGTSNQAIRVPSGPGIEHMPIHPA